MRLALCVFSVWLCLSGCGSGPVAPLCEGTGCSCTGTQCACASGTCTLGGNSNSQLGCTGTAVCKGAVGTGATITCSNSTKCDLSGASASFVCDNSSDCELKVGSGTTVVCNNSADCSVSCTGTCTVTCNESATCRCEGAGCSLKCVSGSPTACPSSGFVCNQAC